MMLRQRIVNRKKLPILLSPRSLRSAGFDAHDDDPLAQLCLLEEDFAGVPGKLKEAADEHAQGRLVSALEGGYRQAGTWPQC